MFKEVYKFNEEVLKIDRPTVFPLGSQEHQWLIGALKEEIQELEDSKSLEEEIDALLDLCYFAIGGLKRMGLSVDQAEECFLAIHRANMTKAKGVKSTRENDGSVADAVKDESFKDPVEKIKNIIAS